MSGGLTNQNFKVTTPAGVFVARVLSDGGELLGIDREHEYRNSVIAAAAGVGAPVIEFRPDDRLLVLGFIEGRTLTNADVAEPGDACQDRAGVRHAAPGRPVRRRFRHVHACRRRYYATATAAGMTIPAGYDDLMPAFAAARRALAVRAEGTVPCNNDLLAANFIDDGERIWLIDYEYSGNNDPCFELGNIAGECCLDADALAALVTAYYGRPRRSRIARAQLFSHGVPVWLDVVGRHSARHAAPRLRLLVLGDGAIRGRGGRLHQP